MTDTTYSIGDGELSQNNFTNTLKSKLDNISDNANNYSLPTASSSVLGGIKVGTNLNIDGSGVLSSTDTTYSVGDGELSQNNFTNTLKSKLDSIEASYLTSLNPGTASESKVLVLDSNRNINNINNISITGNLTISGNNTKIESTTVSVADSMFKYAKNNTANNLDFGFYGQYVENSTTKYGGIYYNSDDTKFHTFIASQTEPTSIVDPNATGYTKGDIVCGNIDLTSLSAGNSLGTNGQILSSTGSGLSWINNYSLPTASSSVLGGIKVGTNLSINGSGVLSSTDTTYSVGDGGLTQNNFTNTLKSKLDNISDNANNYSLPTASSSVLGGIKVGANLNINNGVLSGLSHWTENNSELYYQGNVGIGKVNPTTKLHVGGVTTVDGNILPSSNETYDLGSAAYKFRHLFLSDNSLWVGDNHKISIQNGQMKFRKRISSSVPTSISGLGGDELGLKTFLGVDPSISLSTIKLNQLE